MLTAIDLDDYPSLMRREVREIGTYGGLAPKVMRLERRLPQMLPQLLLGLGRVATQGPGARHALVDGTLHSLWHAPPSPDPSPPRASRAGGGEQVGNRHVQRRAHQ